MTPAITAHGTKTSLVSIGIALISGLLVVAAAGALSHKVAALTLGILAFAGLAVVMGNPRLLCLWGLTATLPFSLNKYFGTNLYKGGGETAFRIEVSEVFFFALAGFL